MYNSVLFSDAYMYNLDAARKGKNIMQESIGKVKHTTTQGVFQCIFDLINVDFFCVIVL